MPDPSPVGPYRRLLLIDDDEALLRALSDTIELRMPAVRVDVCSSIALAEAVIHGGYYDVVICDHHLPGADGSAFLQEALAHASRTVFVLLSGDPLIAEAQWFKNHPRIHFLAKPFDRAVFVHLIHELLRQGS